MDSGAGFGRVPGGTHQALQSGGVADERLLRHRVSRRRARWSLAPSCRTMRLDRAETIPVARQGVWHARGNRATADGVTGASVRSHKPGHSVAPRCR